MKIILQCAISHEVFLDLRLLTKLGNVRKNLKTSQNYCLELSPPPEIKILSVIVKNSLKTQIELFP